MNKLLFILLFCFAVASHLSATNVSGPITSNTTWTVANSPYFVTGNILVLESVTLTIQPGVVVRFDQSKVIQVNGTLIARGTATDSIKFTSNTTQTPGAWGNIYFTGTSIDAVVDNNGDYVSGSTMEYCTVEFGGTIEGTRVNMVSISEALPFIKNSTFKNSLNAGIGIGYSNHEQLNYSLSNNYFWKCQEGIRFYCQFSWLSITNSSFVNNECGICGSGYVIINNNLFSQNNSASLNIENKGIITNNEFSDNKSSDYYSLYGEHIISLVGEINFSNNLCQHNHSNLFYIGPYGNCEIMSNIFTQNNYCQVLIAIEHNSSFRDTSVLANNIITNNEASELVSVSLLNSASDITSNVITNNYVSNLLNIYNYENEPWLTDTATVNFRDNIITQNFSTSDALTIFKGKTSLTSNSLYRNTSAYILKNNNSPTHQPLDISNNYWGVSTNDELSDAIYDFFDNANLGITMFDNILLTPNSSNPVLPPANVVKTAQGNNSVKLSWLPNPEADIKGYNVYWGKFSGYTFEHKADAGLNTSYIIEGASVNDTIAVTAYDNDYMPGKKSTNWQNENMLNGHESAYSFELHFPLGINTEEKTADFSIYPNPVKDKLVVELKNLSNVNMLSIINMQGKTIKTIQLTEKQTEISMDDLSKGMYLVKLRDDKGISMRKIIKM